jgi:hypothetical protein
MKYYSKPSVKMPDKNKYAYYRTKTEEEEVRILQDV